MYRYSKAKETSLSINNSIVGETIEKKVERIVNNNEPIEDSAPLIYGERKNGVNPACDPRTDRWEFAIEQMDKVAKNKIAHRESRLKKDETDNIRNINQGKTEQKPDGTGAE